MTGQRTHGSLEVVVVDAHCERGGGSRDPLVVKVTHAGLPMYELCSGQFVVEYIS